MNRFNTCRIHTTPPEERTAAQNVWYLFVYASTSLSLYGLVFYALFSDAWVCLPMGIPFAILGFGVYALDNYHYFKAKAAHKKEK